MNREALTDEALAARIPRDEEAFSELSSRCMPLLRAAARHFCSPGAPEWDDLMQEGMVGLYAAALHYDEQKSASFRTYAQSCVFHRMADAARKANSGKNRPLNESVSLDSADARQLTAAGKGPQELLEQREQLEDFFERARRRLSPLEKQALALYLEGCPRPEVPRHGMSLRSYDNALYRVRKKLFEAGPQEGKSE